MTSLTVHKGPWTFDEIQHAKSLRDKKTPMAVIARRLGRPVQGVRAKLAANDENPMVQATQRSCIRCHKTFSHEDPPSIKRLCKPCSDYAAAVRSSLA